MLRHAAINGRRRALLLLVTAINGRGRTLLVFAIIDRGVGILALG